MTVINLTNPVPVADEQLTTPSVEGDLLQPEKIGHVLREKPKHILFVEDCPSTLQLFPALMENQAGATVTVVQTAREAKKLLETYSPHEVPFDCIITDRGLKDAGDERAGQQEWDNGDAAGTRLVAWIKERFPLMPTAMLTGNAALAQSDLNVAAAARHCPIIADVPIISKTARDDTTNKLITPPIKVNACINAAFQAAEQVRLHQGVEKPFALNNNQQKVLIVAENYPVHSGLITTTDLSGSFNESGKPQAVDFRLVCDKSELLKLKEEGFIPDVIVGDCRHTGGLGSTWQDTIRLVNEAKHLYPENPTLPVLLRALPANRQPVAGMIAPELSKPGHEKELFILQNAGMSEHLIDELGQILSAVEAKKEAGAPQVSMGAVLPSGQAKEVGLDDVFRHGESTSRLFH